MKSKVFLSCGQRPDEKKAAQEIASVLRLRGFDVYIAIDVQTILEINAGIIRELKDSDYYLFVNFCREEIGRAGSFRGSLFSNQELAIAYSLGFERILVINQKGILPEGMLGYIGINSEYFSGYADCCSIVERALDRSGWTTDYSRRLKAGSLRLSNEIIGYKDLAGRFLYLDICNGRSDIAALGAVGRLASFQKVGESEQLSPIRSSLKATGLPGFIHTIFPRSHEAFDLLCVGGSRIFLPTQAFAPAVSGSSVAPSVLGDDRGVFLNTARDVVGLQRLPITVGEWRLRYEFFAVEFPVLSVSIGLTIQDWDQPEAEVLDQETL